MIYFDAKKEDAREMDVSCHSGNFIVKEGVIDGAARTVFTTGQCHALALALHERTGWPIRVLAYGRKGAAVTSGNHLVVVDPDGNAVDIEGRRPLAEAKRQWGLGRAIPVSPGYVQKMADGSFGVDGWCDLDMNAARMMVDTVLEAYPNAGDGIDRYDY